MPQATESSVQGNDAATLSHRMAQVHETAVCARSNRTHCLTLARFVSKLQPIMREVDLMASSAHPSSSVTGPALTGIMMDVITRVLSLVERAGSMGKCRAIILAEAVITEFQDVTRYLGEYLKAVHKFALHLAEDVNEDIEHLQSQLSRLKYRESKKVQELSKAIRQVVATQRTTPHGTNTALGQLLRQMLNMAKLLDMDADVAHITEQQKKALEQELQDVQEQVWLIQKATGMSSGRDASKPGGKQMIGINNNEHLWLQVQKTLKQIIESTTEAKGQCAPHDAPPDVIEPPEAFVCPISLEVMSDPVILVETAMTYDQTSIEQHFAAGHNICPLSGNVLISKRMLPNYTLKSAIQSWARTHNYIIPRQDSQCQTPALSTASSTIPSVGSLSSSAAQPVDNRAVRDKHDDELMGVSTQLSIPQTSSSGDSFVEEPIADPLEMVIALVQAIETATASSVEPLVRKLCSLTDRSTVARTQLRDSGGIPALVRWLTNGSPSSRGAVAKALWYCARDDDNTALIASAGAIPLLVHLLWGGTNEAKEAAARAFWNLSTYNQHNKVAIAKAGAIPALVHVLGYGCQSSKEAAAGALRSLAVNDDNEAEIVRAGAVPALVNMLIVGVDAGREVALGALHNLARTDWRSEVASTRVVDILRQLSASTTVKPEVQKQAVNLLRRFHEGQVDP